MSFAKFSTGENELMGYPFFFKCFIVKLYSEWKMVNVEPMKAMKEHINDFKFLI